MAASAEDEVLQVEKNWVKAFNTRDVALMTSLYWNSAKTTSFPPNSFQYQGWDEISKMLKEDLAPTDDHQVWSLHHAQVSMLTDSVAILTGYHTVTTTNAATKAQTTDQLRATRVIQKIGGKWLIVHDHGSGLPAK